MEKLLKYLMLALITTFSVCLTSCSDDDKDEPDVPNSTEIKTKTNSWGNAITVWGNYPYGQYANIMAHSYNGSDYIIFQGSYIGEPTYLKIVYIPEANSLSEIRNIPSSGWVGEGNSGELPFNEGGYILQISSYGKPYYIRFWITPTKDASNNIIGFNLQWQEFKI